jgi:hypothetical protein
MSCLSPMPPKRSTGAAEQVKTHDTAQAINAHWISGLFVGIW